MSHHSTCPILCRASQAGQTEIAACPLAQEIISHFTVVFQCFVVGPVWLLGPNGDAPENNHCNHRISESSGWKGPTRSSSPALPPAMSRPPPCPYVSLLHIFQIYHGMMNHTLPIFLIPSSSNASKSTQTSLTEM